MICLRANRFLVQVESYEVETVIIDNLNRKNNQASKLFLMGRYVVTIMEKSKFYEWKKVRWRS